MSEVVSVPINGDEGPISQSLGARSSQVKRD